MLCFQMPSEWSLYIDVLWCTSYSFFKKVKQVIPEVQRQRKALFLFLFWLDWHYNWIGWITSFISFYTCRMRLSQSTWAMAIRLSQLTSYLQTTFKKLSGWVFLCSPKPCFHMKFIKHRISRERITSVSNKVASIQGKLQGRWDSSPAAAV